MKKSYAFLSSGAICVMLGMAAQNAHATLCLFCDNGTNPFMGEYENQIAAYAGWGVDDGFLVPPPDRFVPFYIVHFQYSQPMSFFRLPARGSLNIAQTIGLGAKYGWDWDNFSVPIFYISGDVPCIYGDRWYISAGAGVGLQAHQNERLGAKLLFQFKIAAGARVTERTSLEAYVQHFSNANTAEQNSSYGFYGIGIAMGF